MNIAEIFVLSTGLAMDAFAVSIACGLVIKKQRITAAFKIALFFGFFQAFMPVVGWTLANGFRGWIEAVDHWIAFVILSIIGAKMILDGLKSGGEQTEADPLKTGTLLLLSVATSIDALAAGIGISLLKIPIGYPAIAIGTVTFALSFLGVKLGGRFGRHLEQKIRIFGGVLLVGFGTKILIEHLFS